MKIKILFFSILVIVFSCCKSKRPEPNYYKNLFTQKILTKLEFNEHMDSLGLKYKNSRKKDATINVHFYELIYSKDSIIQPFKYDIRVGNEYIIRAESFEKIGMKILPRKLLSIDGDSIQIGGKQNKPTLINLWFVQCSGCVAEIPALNKIKEKYEGKVNFIAMTFENKIEVIKFLERKEFNFKHIANADQFIGYIGSKPYPENIFINRDGYIQNIEGGLSEGIDFNNTKYFESIIDKLLTTNLSRRISH